MDVMIFAIIVIVLGCGYFLLMWRLGKKKETQQDKEIRETIVNKAFNTFLKEGEHYSVVAKAEGLVLVKKIVRWQYFDINGQKINALFSIETDKGVYCFQLNGISLKMVESSIVLYRYPKLAPKGYNERLKKEYDKKILYGQAVKNKIDFDFDFGSFGVVKKENIDFDDLPRLNNDVNDNKSIEYSLKVAKEWAEIVKSNQNYFENYFLYMMLLNVEDSNNKFWINYRIKEDKFSNKDCEEIFKKIFTSDFDKSLSAYLLNETKMNLGDVIKEKFLFFDYDSFVKGIEVRISISENNNLCVMVQDKYRAVLDTFEEFDKELKGLDFHNDAPKNKVLTIYEIFDIIEFNDEIEYKEKQTKEFDVKKAKEMFPFLPEDYLIFLSRYKIIDYKALQIGDFTWKESNLWENENMQQYLDGYGKNYKVEDWFFIGSDGMGGEYAFSVKNNDAKVYYFDHENPDILVSYANFCEFMFEQLT